MDKSMPSAESLFSKAIELPLNARSGFIAAQCGEDLELLSEVETLLSAHEQAGDFLTLRSEADTDKTNRPAAIKVLRCRADEQLRLRILEEARRAAALNHPAIVTIFSVLDDANPPAIVMEWVEGFPLDRFSANLSFEQKAGLLREVARGL